MTPTAPTSAASGGRIGSASTCLGWAAHLASSWTWCIGMFLPVLLARDLGWRAFVAFALPNVVGAAAMGLVLRRSGASESFVARHRAACDAFSLATIAFQLFFAAYLVGTIGTRAGIIAIVSGLLGATAVGRVLPRPAWLIGAVALAASLVALALAPSGTLALDATPGRRLDALALAPGFAFGFLFCPYLDLTFHRARQAQATGPAAASFLIGFGVLFLAMILATLAYSGTMARGVIPAALAAHIGVQVGATTLLHQRELSGHGSSRLTMGGRSGEIAAGAGLLAGALAAIDLIPFEKAYWCFLSLYALVFPTYVWIMAVGRDPRTNPRRLAAIIATALVVAPFFWLALVQGRTALAFPGGVLLFASRLALALPAFRPGV